MKKTVSIIISGRVQHVGFRYFTGQEAGKYGVEGYVRNLENGDVKVEARAEQEKLDLFIERLRRGPGWARVDSMKISELTAGELKGFKIK